ncbi:hypothetical protein PEX1_079350 [Penicillium expansum]|uniref:Uncharacterized protein n=1 Tax=Penicillium expansum TaxID=27334 RepID=A0A0A2KFJ1_PENEN|nr:hypothetical protein PEX2_064790 [Penicillium expansum]KGO47695.1 hypothetical protein PEXP_013440 [Penicillium expansum]KGO52017.1 hypothetical protein PEX2_064790 [Penicillium expansum]KGO65678.1 hypothetical protein PEX1_079350 [Penicillium expansum]
MVHYHLDFQPRSFKRICYLWIKFLRAPFMSLVEYNRGISPSTDGSTKKMHEMNGLTPRRTCCKRTG